MIINKLKSLATLCAVFVGLISTTTLSIQSVTPSQYELFKDFTNIVLATSIKKFFNYHLYDVVPSEFLSDIKKSIRLYGSEVDKEVQSKANEIFDTISVKDPSKPMDIDDFVLQLKTKFKLPVYTTINKLNENIIDIPSLFILGSMVYITNSRFLFTPRASAFPKIVTLFTKIVTLALIFKSVFTIKGVLVNTAIDDDLKVPASTDEQLTQKANRFIAYCVQQVTIAKLRLMLMFIANESLLIGCLFFEKPVSINNFFITPQLNPINAMWSITLTVKILCMTIVLSIINTIFPQLLMSKGMFDSFTWASGAASILVIEKAINLSYLKEQPEWTKKVQDGEEIWIRTIDESQ